MGHGYGALGNESLTLGEVCRRVRVARGLSRSVVARSSGLAPSTVKRLEDGAAPSARTFERYVEAIARCSATPPLSATQKGFLLDARDHCRLAASRQAAFAPVDYTLWAGTLSDEKRQLLGALSRIGLPAAITDCLGFNHAMNWPAVRLFRLDGSGDFLRKWYAWHFLGSKLAPESPYAATLVGDEGDLQLVAAFAQYAQQYLFTAQATALTRRLGDLSPLFEGSWRATTSLLLSYDPLPLRRIASYNDDVLVFDGVAEHRTVDIGQTGRSATLTVAHWRPRNAHAKEVFEDLAADPRSGEVLLAKDFDTDGDLHVNRWPEVLAALGA